MDMTKSSKRVLRKNNQIHDYRKSNLFAGNTYIDCGDFYKGICFNGEEFLIDKDDYEMIKPYVWHVDSNGYVITKIKNEVFKQHRMILGLDKGDDREVDHIYHNQLDNRKSQLRIADRYENCMNERLSKLNTSGVKGVYQSSDGQRWLAQITARGVKYYLGSYIDFEDAVHARKEAENKYHKEYACSE